MAVDKLVDSTQLDADLTSVANAIRTKGGTSAQMAFPAGFVSAVEDIGADGISVDTWATTGASGRIVLNATSIRRFAFYGNSSITEIYAKNVETVSSNCFQQGGASVAVFPALLTFSGQYELGNITNLIAVDLGANFSSFNQATFEGCTSFNTLIIRNASNVPNLSNRNVFNQTKFANGQSGGTIYIPEILYNHLGDGSSLDYKAATNWSTMDGYGTITWAKIEGSIYETQYADGTPIT